jgi:hypothetical protein
MFRKISSGLRHGLALSSDEVAGKVQGLFFKAGSALQKCDTNSINARHGWACRLH